jgi:hypothetical protein
MDLNRSRRQIWIGVAEFCRLEQAALRHGLTRRELADALFASAPAIDAIAKRLRREAETKQPRDQQSMSIAGS